jgi:hypothetical protein
MRDTAGGHPSSRRGEKLWYGAAPLFLAAVGMAAAAAA